MYGKMTNLKMLYLMTYICYPFKIWRYYYGHLPLAYKYCKIQVARDNFSYYEIHPLIALSNQPSESGTPTLSKLLLQTYENEVLHCLYSLVR